MRKFNFMMAVMAVVALAFAACENPNEPKPGPDGPKPTELTFDAQVVESTKTSVTYGVTPSDLEAEYLVFVYDAKSVEQCETDAEIVAKLYTEVNEYAEANDTTFAAYLADKVKKGAVENGVVNNLVMDTNYYLLVFGVDSAKEFATTTAINKVRFKTKSTQQSACTFEVKADVYLNSAALSVTPSVNTQTWHLINVPIDEYQQYTQADGEYGWSQQEFFLNYLNTEIDGLKQQGLTTEQIAEKVIFKGKRTLNAANLAPKTKYNVLVAGVDYGVDGAFVTTAIKEVRYHSGEAAQSNLTFDIEVKNIEHYSAEVRITPSDPNAEYYYTIEYIDNKAKTMKPIELAERYVTEKLYYWENYTELKHLDPVKGVQDFTGENKLELNIAETEYYIVAFSYELNPTYGTIIDAEAGEYDQNPGTVTSTPAFVTFVTAEHGDPMTANFNFSATDVGPYDFYFEIEAEDPTIYYMPGVAEAEGFNPQAAIDASSSFLAQQMQMCMESQFPCLTYQEALEEKCSMFFRNGSGKYYIANLNPETDYIGYVLAIDIKTGKFARCVYSDIIATTSSLGSVTPSIEVLGVYNGDQENGTLFGDKNLTMGRPIVAVKFNDIDDASAVYCALSSDKCVDVEALPDCYIIADFRGYWQALSSLAVPYHFFVAEWDVEQTVVAYAQDANGNEGLVGCLGVFPSESRDIEELKGYVDAVNNASAQAAVKSMVINEAPMAPTMECIWSEEVGAPRDGQVFYHEVEPLKVAVESDVISLGMVKSFAL